jgi:2-dehydro-3-deoxygalactonokinase
MARTTPLVGVDWGTTHRRGHLLVDGSIVAEASDAQGALAARGRFPEALRELLDALGGEARQAMVVMSGMVGSAFGWREVPYLDTRVPLPELARHLAVLDDTGPGGAPRWIVPGYMLAQDGHVDVMRGEEMQLLGAVALGHANGWFVLPGTHSKWVLLQQGRIARFWTFMTGELYGLLMSSGTLASAAGGTDAFDGSAFDAGLDAQEGAAVSHALFGARARAVTGRMPRELTSSYVSGVLIAAEWRQMRRLMSDFEGDATPGRVTVIGAPALQALHERAAARFDFTLSSLDPRDAYAAALVQLAGHLGEKTPSWTP